MKNIAIIIVVLVALVGLYVLYTSTPAVTDCGTDAQCFLDAAEQCTPAKAVLNSVEIPYTGGIVSSMFTAENIAAEEYYTVVPIIGTYEITGGTIEACEISKTIDSIGAPIYYNYGTVIEESAAPEYLIQNAQAATQLYNQDYVGTDMACTLPSGIITGSDTSGFDPTQLFTACTGKNPLLTA